MRAMVAVTDILRGQCPLLQVDLSMSTASQSSLSGVDNASSRSQMV